MMQQNVDFADWYRANKELYHTLANVVEATITSLLNSRNISFVAVATRVKVLDSLLEKCRKKNYSEIQQVTDLLGVRVILYLESDVALANSIIEEAFEIDRKRSVNKSDELAVNQLGYRSTHHICSLGEERLKLPELSAFKGCKFEVQVRTILQHAWAEIEHDRSYKYSGDLPKKYRRRLNLLSGTLELIDREFSTLSRELDEHTSIVTNAKVAVDLEDEISSYSFKALIDSILDLKFEISGDFPVLSIKEELNSFGLYNIGDVKNLISPEFINATNIYEPEGTSIGFLRNLMMFTDVEKYFSYSWKNSWQGIESHSRQLLEQKYTSIKLFELWTEYEIDLDIDEYMQEQ